MTRSKIAAWALVIALLLALAVPTAAAEDQAGQAAEAAAACAMEYGGAVSAQYALWQDGEIVLSGAVGAYAKGEAGEPLEDTLYGIGSVSKIYTTAAVMKLVERGLVALDEPVTRYIPEFTMADGRYREITVRMLLNHSSGLMGTTNRDAFLLADRETSAAAQLLQQLSTQTLQADPGAYSVYCNDGFTLAQLVVERVSGVPFAQFLAEEITGPLALRHTFTPQDDFPAEQLAKAYLTAEDSRALPQETLSIVGTGGMYASASDLAAFGGAFCTDALLSRASREAMAAEEYLRGMWPADSEGDALSYGLGWDCVHMFPFSQNGIQALVKGGDSLVYHAGLVVLPEYGMAAAVLSSGGLSTYNQLAAARILIDALARQGVTVEEEAALEPSERAAMPEELGELSGAYAAGTGVVRIDLSADGVLSLRGGGAEQRFTYRTDGSFRDEGNSLLLKLVEEENGEVYLFQKAYQAVPGLTGMCTASYALQRLPEQKVDEEALKAWEDRMGKLYLLVDEHYTSALYPFGAVFGAMAELENLPEGYVAINAIADGSTAVPVLQIPGTGSRDSAVIHMVKEDGGEYMELAGSLYQDAALAADIYPGARAYCTISRGRARWYAVGEAAGKTMTVDLPEQGSFAVYDANLQPIASSWAYGDTQVLLPDGGYVVFSGEDGSRFTILMTGEQKK